MKKISVSEQELKNIIFGLGFWAEVSGAIEHYFKKCNGFPMPNTIVSGILNVSESDIIPSRKDEVHYERKIDVEGDYYEKMIFGIKDEETFNKAVAAVENYGNFMQTVNKLNESVNYTPRQAIFIIENIYRAHEEDGFNELIPSWHKALQDSLTVLNSMENKTKEIWDYMDYAEYLLGDMPLLVLHKF